MYNIIVYVYHNGAYKITECVIQCVYNNRMYSIIVCII
jgi:hypothetical protein